MDPVQVGDLYAVTITIVRRGRSECASAGIPVVGITGDNADVVGRDSYSFQLGIR